MRQSSACCAIEPPFRHRLLSFGPKHVIEGLRFRPPPLFRPTAGRLRPFPWQRESRVEKP